MMHWIRLSAARSANALVLAALAGLALASCGGGGGSDSNFTPPDNGGTPTCADASSPSGLPISTLTVGSQQVCAEVASTPEQREQGLMGRQGLAANSGMLFEFSETTTICMWMQDTSIPLSVAFIDQNGIILNIEDMTPLTTEQHCSWSPALFSLEMTQGWFAANGIVPGMSVSGLP